MKKKVGGRKWREIITEREKEWDKENREMIRKREGRGKEETEITDSKRETILKSLMLFVSASSARGCVGNK